MNSFADFLLKIAPGWLIDNHTGRQYQIAKGEAFDELMGLYADAAKARIIATADAEALYLLGSERGLDVFPDEPIEVYRRRVQGAWDFWIWAGTNTGILIVLAQMGFKAKIFEHFRTEPDKWAEFSIDFAPVDVTPSPSKYDDPGATYDEPGTRYDVYMKYTEIDRVRSLVDKIKSAQSRLRRLTFVITIPPRYDDPDTLYDTEGTTYTPDNYYAVEL